MSWHEENKNKETNRGLEDYNAWISGKQKTSLQNELISNYEEWKNQGKPGKKFKVLEVGAGKGKALKELIEHLTKNADINDFEFNAVNLLKKDFEGFQVNNVNTLIADAEKKLPFNENSIHFIYSVWAAPYMKNKLSFLCEVNRVLHPAGKAVVHIVRDAGKTIINGKTVLNWLKEKGLSTTPRAVHLTKTSELPEEYEMNSTPYFFKGSKYWKTEYTSRH